jgi:hypothetical protein
MFVSIRRYRDVPSTTKLCRDIELEFAPRLKRSPGFVAYYVIDGGDRTLTTVTVFSTPAMAEESNAAAADWLRQRDPDNRLQPVEVVAGRLVVAVPPFRG